jgi:hypothetical protein
MLWGSHESGASFGVNVNNIAGDLTLELKNGSWDFYITAWDGGSGDLSGEVKCATASETFDGGEAVVNLTLTNATCADSVFGVNSKDNSGTREFFPLIITSCSDITAVDASGYCRTNESNKGHLRSFKVTMPDFINGDIGGVIPLSNIPLESTCDDDPDVAASQMTFPNLNIPAGNGLAPFKTQLIGYFDTGCNPSKGVVVENLDKGIYVPTNGTVINGSVEVHHGDVNTDITNVYHLLTDVNACNLSDPNVISIGTGTSQSPYALCTPQQFNSIGSDSGYLSSSFKLFRDIDFSGQITGIFNPLGDVSCGDIGSSVQPIGGLYSDTTNCTTQQLSAPITDFTGEFDGNNRVLRNVFIMEEDYSRVGLFRRISGSAVVKDLRIENAEVEGNDHVGILAGEVSGANEISGITITEFYVDAGISPSYVGSVAGALATVTNLNNIHSVKGIVEGDGDYIGGLFGVFSNALTVASFYGEITSDYDVEKVGGIAGDTSSSNFTSVTSKGAMSGGIIKAGGIIGNDNSSTSITDSYSEMYISSRRYATNLQIGGLVGSTAGTSIANSYFNGKIDNECNDGTPANCKVGNISGGASSPTGTVSLPSAVPWGGVDGADFTSYTNLITGGYKTSTLGSGYSWGGNWNLVHTNLPPKLAWESTASDPCLEPLSVDTIANQIGASRGQLNNPIIICNHNQLSNIGSYSTYHYKIQNIINLAHLGPIASSFDNNFQGSIDGSSYLIHSGDFSTSGVSNYGMISILDVGAKIKNLKFAVMSATTNQNIVGAIIGNNKGVLENIEVIDSSSASCPTCSMIGGIVGKNEGVMRDVIYNYGNQLLGQTSIGGLAGANFGEIRRGISNASIFPSTSVSKVGGAVGDNKAGAVLEEIQSNSSIQISFGGSKIGGIAGENEGTVRDVSFGEHGEILIKTDIVTTEVGGIIGRHTGSTASLQRSINLASIVSLNPTIPSDFGGTIGFHSAPAVIGPKNFFMSFPKSPSIQSRTIGSAATTTDCDIDIGIGPSIAAGDTVLVAHSSVNKVFTVSSIGATTISVLDPGGDCTTINSNGGPLFEMKGDFFSDVYGSSNNTTGASVSGVCQATAASALSIADNDYVYFNQELGSFRVNNVSGINFDIPDVTDAADCALLSSESFIEVPVSQTSNGFGVQRVSFDLQDIGTYCDGAIPGASPNFKCSQANGWDIVEDDPSGTGSNYLRQYFASELLKQPRPSNAPIWAVEHGQDFPSLLMDW